MAMNIGDERIEDRPSVRVTSPIKIRPETRSPTMANLVKGFAAQFCELDCPGKVRVSVCLSPNSADRAGPKGVLHAKSVIAGEARLVVTSANLTEAALNLKIETVVLMLDRTLGNVAARHSPRLIDHGSLKTASGLIDHLHLASGPES